MGQFLVHRTGDGCRYFQLHDADGLAVLRSTAMQTDEVAAKAIDWLKAAVGDDRRYLVGTSRHGPYFRIGMPYTRVVCASPEFSSCDAMERAIALLKAIALSAPIVYVSGRRNQSNRAQLGERSPQPTQRRPKGCKSSHSRSRVCPRSRGGTRMRFIL